MSKKRVEKRVEILDKIMLEVRGEKLTNVSLINIIIVNLECIKKEIEKKPPRKKTHIEKDLVFILYKLLNLVCKYLLLSKMEPESTEELLRYAVKLQKEGEEPYQNGIKDKSEKMPKIDPILTQDDNELVSSKNKLSSLIVALLFLLMIIIAFFGIIRLCI